MSRLWAGRFGELLGPGERGLSAASPGRELESTDTILSLGRRTLGRLYIAEAACK